jgi:hypothetical protein
LRPAGADAGALTDCRRLLDSASAFTASLAVAPEEPADARPAPDPEILARLPPDRRKLVAAVALATARLRPARYVDDPAGSGHATRS